MNTVLDEHVPPFDEPADWNDVLRRAGRRRRIRRPVLAAIVAACAVFAVAPALAVLLHDDGVGLPAAADRSNVAVVIAPVGGRVLLQVAPWKGHAGFCYLVLRQRAGCVPRKAHGTVVLWPPLFGWSFDPAVRTGTATTLAGKHVPLTVVHYGGKLDVTLFLVRGRLPRLLNEVVLRDRAGHVVARVRPRR
jgi:hypothetical protein